MGRLLSQIYVKYGSLGWSGVGTGIAPSQPTPVYPHPGYTPPPHRTVTGLLGLAVPVQCAVGLISVDQLSLSVQISGFRGITEVYNVV